MQVQLCSFLDRRALRGFSLGSAHSTVHGRLASIFGPVKVYGGEESLLSGYSLQEKAAYPHEVQQHPSSCNLLNHTNSAVYLAYSCLSTRPIAQNRNIKHNIDKKVAYKQFQDRGLSRFPASSAEPSAAFQSINANHRTVIQPSDSLMNTPTLWVANISAWRWSVFPRSKLMDLLNTSLEFPIHSLWPAAELLPQPSYVTSSCKSAIIMSTVSPQTS